MVIVMAVPADGAIKITRMLYFLPPMARGRGKAMIAAFAVEYYRYNGQSEEPLSRLASARLLVRSFCLWADQSAGMSRGLEQHNLQIPTLEAVVRILPYFCFWKMGQTALTD